jgi:hypothetical protein
MAYLHKRKRNRGIPSIKRRFPRKLVQSTEKIRIGHGLQMNTTNSDWDLSFAALTG